MSARDPGVAALARVQGWLQAAISDPGVELRGDHEPASSVVRASSRMDPAQRVGVYRGAYAARLLECLADDYPALRALLGRAGFAGLCRRYVAAFPPRSPSLNGYGANLPEFSAREATAEAQAAGARLPGCTPALLSDLAVLEWAHVELIHAPEPPALTLADVTARQSEFAAAALVPKPALRLLRLEHRVHALFAALRTGQPGALPAAPAQPSFVLVQRSGWELVSDELAADEGALLARVLAGQALGAALAAAAELGTNESEVATWFQRWLQAGLFCAFA